MTQPIPAFSVSAPCHSRSCEHASLSASPRYRYLMSASCSSPESPSITSATSFFGTDPIALTTTFALRRRTSSDSAPKDGSLRDAFTCQHPSVEKTQLLNSCASGTVNRRCSTLAGLGSLGSSPLQRGSRARKQPPSLAPPPSVTRPTPRLALPLMSSAARLAANLTSALLGKQPDRKSPWSCHLTQHHRTHQPGPRQRHPGGDMSYLRIVRHFRTEEGAPCASTGV